MKFCEKCGEEVKDEDPFCPSCGASLKERKKPWELRSVREEDLCFGGREPRGDPIGLVNLGLFFLVIGAIYTINPNILSEIITWFRLLTETQMVVRPPITLINSAAIFFGLIGISNFVTAGIRIVIDKVWRRILPDILTGIGLMSFAYFINQYSRYTITWFQVLGSEAVVFGILVIIYAVFRGLF